MNPFPLAWTIWAVAFGVSFVVLEVWAFMRPDTAEAPRTLTANVRRFISGRGWFNTAGRIALTALLAWLPPHFGLVDLG